MAKKTGRARSVKPELYFDYELAKLPMVSRYAFIGLMCQADREGRMEDNPARLRALIFPYEHEVDMEKILVELTGKPFIVRYSANSKNYIQIVQWKAHQKVHHTESVSAIPNTNGELTVNEPLVNGNVAACISPNGIYNIKTKAVYNKKHDSKKYGDFVYMTEEQYDTLCESIGKGNTDSYIERLDNYIGSKGKRYNSHYHVVKAWWRRDNPDERPKRTL